MQMPSDKEVINVDESLGKISLLENVIMSGIQNVVLLAKQGRSNGTPEEVARDTSTYALQVLLGSTQLRSAKAVKDIQQAMGPIPQQVRGRTYPR